MKSRILSNFLSGSAALLLLISVVFTQSCDDNDGNVVASSPFKVVGTQLQDPCGETVMLKGVNKMSVFDEQDPYGRNYFPEIAKTNANCVRIVWKTRLRKGVPTVLSQLDSLIKNCIKNKMIPMIELHDATCHWDSLDDVVNYWIRPDVVSVIQKYQHALLVNIANEAGNDEVTDAQFLAGYKSAITQMRNAGIHTPLIIDGKVCGKDLDVLVATGPALMTHDPDHNVMFSVHTYWSKLDILSVQPTFIKDQLKKAKDANIPLILGELCAYGGWAGEYPPGTVCPEQWTCQEQGSIDYQTFLSEAAANNFGYLVWEWGPGNGFFDCKPPVLCPAMDMTTDGTYQSIVNIPAGSTPRGWVRDVVMDSPYSIKNTATKSSYILNGFVCR